MMHELLLCQESLEQEYPQARPERIEFWPALVLYKISVLLVSLATLQQSLKIPVQMGLSSKLMSS